VAGGQGEVLYLPNVVTPTKPTDLLAAPAPVPEPLQLPAPAKMRPVIIEHKAAEDVADSIDRLRNRLAPRCEADMARFFTAQATRIVGRLYGGKGLKADVPDADELVPASEADELRKALDPWYLRALDGVHDLTEAGLGVAFQLDDPVTRAYLLEAGDQIVGITETTRAAVADALRAGQAEGEGLAKLAKRIRDLPEFDRARATLVARTELGQASNKAALTSYRASGVVVGVLYLDGDDDPICAAVNGRRVTLAEAGSIPALGHPRCIRALAPITDAAELAA
jgi:hypothetical protein